MTRLVDPSEIAKGTRSDLRQQVAAIDRPLKVVGVLCSDYGPSVTYARYSQVGCEDVGIEFELRQPNRFNVESALKEANQDPDVHGILVFYPVFANDQDNYIKDLVSPEKDIEGLNSQWSRMLYANQRYVDEHKAMKAILPCTPLAIVKLLETTRLYEDQVQPLSGRTITVFNRSEVVGRPLAAMLANDGARVHSFDVLGPVLFTPDGAQESNISRAEALAESNAVITGVPVSDFPLIQAQELKPNTVGLNFSTVRNFSDEAIAHCEEFVPRVGPMTVTMAVRNTVRLYENYHA